MMEKATVSPLETYRSYLAQHQLAYQFSPAAGKAVFFPRLVCPFTGSTTLEWRVSQGRGAVHATSVVFPRDGEPYNVALIELDEGFRMMSRVDGQPPHSVCIGQKVRVTFILEAGQTVPLAVFVADGESQHD